MSAAAGSGKTAVLTQRAVQLITDPVDMYRLFGVIAGVMVLCLFTLILLVFKMNVSKALKLGEE